MASHIQNKTISSTYTSPVIKYDVKYTSKRDSNSKVTYTFNITPWLDGSNSQTWFGTGYGLKCTIKVNGVSGSATLKSTSESWVNYSADQKRATKTISITCNSTTANAQQTVSFVVTRPDGLGNTGKVSTTDYYVLSPALISTKCSAPTFFTASSNNFEDNVVLKWSGAKSGVNQSISSYLIRYRTSSNNSTWSGWADLSIISSTSTSGSKTINMSSKVPRGYYVQFAIRTQPSNTNYVSSWAFSTVIRRKPYTKCTAPTTFTVSANNFDTTITISWSGASGGTNNAINSYSIQYSLSSNNSSWGDWITLQNISTTKTSYTFSKNVSSIISRGQYVKFRIRTQGSAGTSYYSDYKVSSSIRRNLYSSCTSPTSIELESEKSISGDVYDSRFNASITIKWSGAKSGDNNEIKAYQIEYQTSSSSSFGSTWTVLTKVTTTKKYTYNGTGLTRGHRIRFRIKTIGTVSGYDSDYIISDDMVRNSVPSLISKINISVPSSESSSEFSIGDTIQLFWESPDDEDNNICKYEIVVVSDLISTPTIIETKNVLYGGVDKINYFTTFKPTNAYVKNNGQIRFGIRAIDTFGECQSSYSWTDFITRYDITGVAIGMNGKWVNCQLFVGSNGSWVEQSASVGIDNSWIDADDGD
jgi:hypothetical protein